MSTGVEGRARLLGERDFRLWFLSRSASVAGTAASAVALPLLAYSSSGSATLTAAVVGLEALPYLLFGLFAGAAADRLPRRAMMVGADVGCALLLCTLVLAAWTGTPSSWHILLVAFGLGCGFCWFDAAAWGAQARLAGRDRLPEANSLVLSAEIVVGIAAPAAAGLLAAVVDPAAVLAADAASYLVSACLVASLRSGLDAGGGARWSVRQGLTEIGDGLRYLWREPTIRTLSLTGFGFNLSAGGAIGLLAVHADEVLDMRVSDGRIGLLYTAAAIGALIAARVLPALGRRAGAGPTSIIGYAGYVLALLALVHAPSFAAAAALWAAWEFTRTVVNVNGITVRQQLTPDGLQGRVNTTGRMIAWGGTPFGALIGGVVAQQAGVPAAYLVLAVPAAAGLVVLLTSPVRRLRVAALRTD
jgi:MFS family permease